jgi:hypothetical protein
MSMPDMLMPPVIGTWTAILKVAFGTKGVLVGAGTGVSVGTGVLVGWMGVSVGMGIGVAAVPQPVNARLASSRSVNKLRNDFEYILFSFVEYCTGNLPMTYHRRMTKEFIIDLSLACLCKLIIRLLRFQV